MLSVVNDKHHDTQQNDTHNNDSVAIKVRHSACNTKQTKTLNAECCCVHCHYAEKHYIVNLNTVCKYAERYFVVS